MSSVAHVRTHYDCYHHVLLDNWLSRYVVRQATEIIEELQPDLLVGFGLAETSVFHITSQMGAQFRIRHVMRTPDSLAYLDNIPQKSKVLLVSDMVLTGSTAESLKKEIESADSRVIGLLTLLSLSNSTREFGDDIPVRPICTINRPFYPSENQCPLCRCAYPSIEVHSLSDFRRPYEFIHPYDFWEAVHESRAFSSSHIQREGKHFTYYIDIHRLCKFYAEPIARQMLRQLKTLPSYVKPKAILYPESKAAKVFAQEVARQLHINHVMSVSREYLSILPRTDHFELPSNLELIRGKQILVVDDGCNTLKTISEIEDLLNRSHAISVGYLVILNRANVLLTSRKIRESGGKFQFYYHWPVSVYRNEDDCPECGATGATVGDGSEHGTSN